MHGLGNDFVVVDAREQLFSLSGKQIQALADRKTGIGFDQLLVLESIQGCHADFMYRVFNADGGEVGQCGNGARCMGLFIQMQGISHQQQWLLQTTESILRVQAGEKGEVLVRTFDMDENILVEVADNGNGIPQKHLSKIFERFYRVDKTRSRHQGGSGLGLSIVKHIIEAHNEKIFVDSQLGIGSEFSFTLEKKI